MRQNHHQKFHKAQIELLELLHSTNLEGNKFPGELGISRVKSALEKFENPQNKFKIIHIAGTSGKGSTAFILSKALSSLKFKVGLTLSPHVLNIRERIQINNEMISEEDFASLYFEVKNQIIELSLTYFEILSVMAFVYFRRHSVDYGVIETGLGGIYDASNVIENKNKVCIITRIGLDHTHILGDSLEKIAYQKAGIIGFKNTTFTITQNENILKVFKDRAIQQDADLKIVSIKNHPKIKIGLIGEYQQENASLALKVVEFLSLRDQFQININSIKTKLSNIKLFGRFTETKLPGLDNVVILDGAHNPQKIQAFTNAVKERYPKSNLIFVLAFKHGKDITENLKPIIEIADKIFLTTYKDEKNKYLPNDTNITDLKASIKSLNFENYEIEPNLNKLIEKFKNSKNEIENNVIIFTGSFYLIGRLAKDYDI